MSGHKSLLQRELDDSSSDGDDYLIFSAAQIVKTFSNAKGRHGDSVPGHQVIHRDREGGHQRMFQDYLTDDLTYIPHLLHPTFISSEVGVHSLLIGTYYVVINYYMSCLTFFVYFRYGMSRELFLCIMNAVESHDDYFVQKRVAANVLGLSCFQKNHCSISYANIRGFS